MKLQTRHWKLREVKILHLNSVSSKHVTSMNNVIWTDSKYVKVKEKSNGAIEEGEEDRQGGEKDGFWEY